jgi:hypothetical protein
MIGQYLPNNNETATVVFRQNFCQLNSPYLSWLCCLHVGSMAGRSGPPAIDPPYGVTEAGMDPAACLYKTLLSLHC